MKKLKYMLALFIFVGCGKSQAQTKALSLVNWNVQTFFDAETEGTEYQEFLSAGHWSKDKYLVRLKRLCEVMRTLNADVFVLEEIENEAVIFDISNQLVGETWSEKNKWYYSCFAKEDSSAIGCAVISKYPLSNLKTHSMDIRCQSESQPRSRPLMQVTVNADGVELVLFIAHWKSKSGGEEESEIWRDWQESLLGTSIIKSGAQAAVICGDFNRDARDFIVSFDGADRSPNTVIRAATGEGTKTLRLYNPWFDATGSFSTEIGSYFFNNAWERIDQIFAYGNVRLSSFAPRAESPWASERFLPISYKLYTGEGYSDHLPVMCTLILGN